MKKYIFSFAIPLAVLSLAVAFSVPANTQAQVACPAGYTCTPVAPQPTGCPVGYTCTPISNPVNSGGTVTSDSGGTQICLNFSTYLGIGSSGQDVSTLQTWLILSGFDIPYISHGWTAKGYFGTQTARALSQYQTSVGLPATGVVDAATLAKLNSVGGNGCMQYKNPQLLNTPVISGVTGPTSLSVGQSGSWKVNAYDPNNRRLTYGVDWGDSPAPPKGTAFTASAQQTPYFAHSYTSVGTYTAIFQVMNDSGLTAQTSVTVIVGNGTDGQVSIKVISPNGGQTIRQGQTITIQWSAQGIPSSATMNINLSNSNGVVGQIVTGLNPNTSQSYSWNTGSPIGTISTISGSVPEYIYPGQYKIDLEASWPVPVTDSNQKGMAGVTDLSDNYFTVTDSSGNLPVAPSISFSSPPSIPNDGVTVETVNGSGFNSSSAVYFSNSTYSNAYKTIPNYISPSGQSLTFVVSQNFPPVGQYQMMVSNDGITMSNPSSLLITAAQLTSLAPTITSVNPTSAPVGSSVTINGSGFDSNSYVDIGGQDKQGNPFTAIVPSSVSANSLTFIVPSSGTNNTGTKVPLSGNYTIQVGEITKYTPIFSNTLNFTVTATQSTGTNGWQTYSDSQDGISFQYPSSLNSNYASLVGTPQITVTPTGASTIDNNGCLQTVNGSGRPGTESQVNLNGVAFCLSTAGEAGMSQLYTTYDYTTYRNGSYITLQYVIHTPNGCGVFLGGPNYNDCQTFENNYNSVVVQPLQQSVSTLTFTH
ncbi:MAG: peptidoglycan-binding protein [Patescibacteria group bacterium]|nr:peptidoglycan-binding protein [Patescibacteria group bacterium]